MKNKIFLIVFLLMMFPSIKANAEDYTLKSGKSVTGSYNEADYNYYKIKPSKNGYLAITSKTSNGSVLQMDICNENKEVIASDIKIKNKGTVFHKAKKGSTYYLRIKGKQGITYSISYKVNTIDTLEYAKKYNYIFTNASFYNQDNAITLKIKANKSGILNFMCNCNDKVIVKYLDSSKKVISMSSILEKNSLTGIGVQSGKTYYIKMWKPDSSIAGTTSINNMKYQIEKISLSNHSSRSKAKELSKDKYVNTLVPAGKTTTTWYKIKMTKKKKLSITIESHMMQNNGQCLQLYICNSKGKKLNSNSIIIDNEISVKYKNKKYIMTYPKKTFSTTVAFPVGTYYLKVESKTKTSSGSYQIKWK